MKIMGSTSMAITIYMMTTLECRVWMISMTIMIMTVMIMKILHIVPMLNMMVLSHPLMKLLMEVCPLTICTIILQNELLTRVTYDQMNVV